MDVYSTCNALQLKMDVLQTSDNFLQITNLSSISELEIYCIY